MIKVNSTVNLDMALISQLCSAQIEALEQTAEALHTEVVQAQIVPRKDGALQGESFFVDTSNSSAGRVQLVHAEPYARRLYFHPEYNFHKGPWEDADGKHDGNPNAKGEWYEDYVPGGKYDTFAQKKYRELYRRIAGL